MNAILEKIAELAAAQGCLVYVVGGAVRDQVMARPALDIDLAINRDALQFGQLLAQALPGKFIVLDAELGVGRLACQGHVIDLALFRDGARFIEEDLRRRDFTINAMAYRLNDWLAKRTAALIDPCGGQEDIRQGVIRLAYPEALQDDPLRILRGFRLQAITGFGLAESFLSQALVDKERLRQPAPERITTELNYIFASSRAGDIVAAMARQGILEIICPELWHGSGVEQPASHHLDVFEHNLAALQAMDDIIRRPGHYFPEQLEVMAAYLAEDRHPLRLRWAALFHDLGKPRTKEMKEGRITFYQHDLVGARIFQGLAKRLRFTNRDSDRISLFISQHMRPFHLCNIMRRQAVSAKACLRLAKAVGEDLPGIFLLAMADSLAGQGEEKPADMERDIARLFNQVQAQMEAHVRPALSGPPLLTGHDLISAGLKPGPIFKKILDTLLQAQVAGEIDDRDAALAWLRKVVENTAW